MKIPFKFELNLQDSNPKTIVMGMVVVLCLQASYAFAGMPWESGLCNVMQSMGGPTAKMLVVIAFVVTGALWAFNQVKGLFHDLAGLVAGGSMSIGAVQWVNSGLFTTAGASIGCGGA